jgi:hypothetical protein
MENEKLLPPRPLSSEELALLTWMLKNGSPEAKTFAPQIEGIRASGWCPCGCPSIDLHVEESAPLGNPQGGKVICDFWGRTAREELVGVLLFQNGGRLSLLEGYSVDGQIQADPPEFGFPTLESLRELSEGEPPATIPS